MLNTAARVISQVPSQEFTLIVCSLANATVKPFRFPFHMFIQYRFQNSYDFLCPSSFLRPHGERNDTISEPMIIKYLCTSILQSTPSTPHLPELSRHTESFLSNNFTYAKIFFLSEPEPLSPIYQKLYSTSAYTFY